MKKLLFGILILAVVIGIGSWSSPAKAEDVTFNLKATWNANSEPDLAGYYMFHKRGTDGVWSAWNGTDWNGAGQGTLIPKPTTQLLFASKSVPDIPTTGTLDFQIQSGDTNGNFSARSTTVSYNYNTDTTPPAVPTGLTVVKQ